MGGFFSSLAEKAGTAAEHGLESLTAKSSDTLVGRLAQDIGGNKEWLTHLAPQAEAIGKQIEEFHRIKSTSLDSMNKNLESLWGSIKNDNNLRNKFDYSTAKLSDIHQHLSVAGHPDAKASAAILAQATDPATGLSRYANDTLSEASLRNKGEAKLNGIAGSFGDHYQNISPLIANLLEHPDPRMNMLGHRMGDIVSNEVHDTAMIKRGDHFSLGSTAKSEMNKTFEAVNKFRKRAGEGSEIPSLHTDPTYYAPNKIERTLSSVLRTVQIPFVALPHLGQYFHIPATAPLLDGIGRSLLRMDHKQMTKTVEMSSILANTEWDVIHSDIAARTGRVARWTGSPTAASIISKSIHTPLFNYARLQQLATAGSVGFHSAIYYGKMATKGDKLAIAELNEMGIDVAAVLARKGKLTEEELAKGVYHWVNNRMLVNKTIDQPLLMNKNFVARSAYMYHSFVRSETAFIKREILKRFKAEDIKGIAQFAGTLGIVFPAVAPLLKSAEMLVRTGSPAATGAQLQKDYTDLMGKNGIKSAASAYIDMLSHIGAAGAALNYANAIKGHRLANAMMGPMLGMAATDAEDAYNAAFSPSKTGKHPLKPLERDALQMVPVFGKPLSHRLIPSTKEESSIHFNSRRSRRRKF